MGWRLGTCRACNQRVAARWSLGLGTGREVAGDLLLEACMFPPVCTTDRPLLPAVPYQRHLSTNLNIVLVVKEKSIKSLVLYHRAGIEG